MRSGNIRFGIDESLENNRRLPNLAAPDTACTPLRHVLHLYSPALAPGASVRQMQVSGSQGGLVGV